MSRFLASRCGSLAAAVVLALATVACDDGGGGVRLYHTEPKADGLTDDSIAALDHLGPTLTERGVNFGVYSKNATRVDLLLFEDPEAELPTRQFEMTRFGDVWNLFVEGIGPGQAYGFVAWGPNWPFDPAWTPGHIDGFISDVDAAGNRFDPNKLLIDPYGKALHREHDWAKGSIASGPARTESTWSAAAKSVVVTSQYEWSAGEDAWLAMRKDPDAAGHRFEDLVVYEVHPKGFTASPASGVEHPGTYRGIAEKADYLKDLGITAVELMPVHEKPLDGGYWGYQTISFFAPEQSYASRPEPEYVIDEFKAMFDALHQRGIEVILDVVYNHTGEGGLWREKMLLDDTSLDPTTDGQVANFDAKEVAGLYSFRGLDNAEYYALNEGNQTYWNNTGVGDETRCNNRPMRRLIMDSLRFYADELHVDGFRFDLAPILGEKDLDFNDWDDPANTVLQDIIDDPDLRARNTRIIAEPWSAGGSYGVRIGAFPAASDGTGDGWMEWNGRFRDWWRAFLNQDGWKLDSVEGDADGGFLMTACDRYYQPSGRRPWASVNFLTVHDGFTLYDVFSYDQKQNNCGPLNPVCCEQPLSPWCDTDSGESNNRSKNWGSDPAQEDFKRQLMRDAFVGLLISHGTPMLLGGDEWMRTQLGNNNAYSTRADNSYNWFDWGSWQASPERVRMHDFVQKLIAFRKAHAYALAPGQYGDGAPFAWKSPGNDDNVDWHGKRVMQHYYDGTRGPELLVMINGERTGQAFTLPTGRTWRRVLDTQSFFDTADYFTGNAADPTTSANFDAAATTIPGTSYDVPGSTIVILEAAP